MKNGKDAGTSKMDEEVLPPKSSWVQDTKHKPWISLEKISQAVKGLRDTFEEEEFEEMFQNAKKISDHPTLKNRKQYKLCFQGKHLKGSLL